MYLWFCRGENPSSIDDKNYQVLEISEDWIDSKPIYKILQYLNLACNETIVTSNQIIFIENDAHLQVTIEAKTWERSVKTHYIENIGKIITT